MNRLPTVEAIRAAGAGALAAAGKALDPRMLLTVAALAMGACRNDDKGGPLDGDTGSLPPNTITTVDTDTAADSDTAPDTDTAADTDTVPDTDTSPGVGDTSMSQVACEALPTFKEELISPDQFVDSLGYTAEYDASTGTFTDKRFAPTDLDENVYACLYQGQRDEDGELVAASETRVIRIPATDTDPETLQVEGELQLLGGAVLLHFVTPEDLYIAPNSSAQHALWLYEAAAGEVSDIQYIAGTDNRYVVVNM